MAPVNARHINVTAVMSRATVVRRDRISVGRADIRV